MPTPAAPAATPVATWPGVSPVEGAGAGAGLGAGTGTGTGTGTRIRLRTRRLLPPEHR